MRNLLLVFISSLLLSFAANVRASDALPSWNEGLVKQSILDFVKRATDKASPDYVAPEDRIATFDNDGTMWLEQPIYTQVIFAFSRIKAMAPQHPEWKTEKPYSLILSDDPKVLSQLTMQDLLHIMGVTHSGMTVEAFDKLAKDWLQAAKNPRFKHLYTELVYQPMLEVMNYLRQNDFKIYIVSGGGQDFMRAFTQQVYGVAPSQVIGTFTKTKYTNQDKQPALVKMPDVLMVDDKEGKPEDIYLFIGKKPIIAFGNSDGDKEMLEWTQSTQGAHLMLLVHHDDAKREYAYGPESKIGTFSDALMAEANANHWQVISMQHDWKVVFPFEKK